MILIIIIIETCANISRVRTNSFRTINACVSIGFMNEQAGCESFSFDNAVYTYLRVCWQ